MSNAAHGSTGPYARYAAPPAANEGYAQGAGGYGGGAPGYGAGGAAPGYGGQGGYAPPPGAYGQQQYVDPAYQQVRTNRHIIDRSESLLVFGDELASNIQRYATAAEIVMVDSYRPPPRNAHKIVERRHGTDSTCPTNGFCRHLCCHRDACPNRHSYCLSLIHISPIKAGARWRWRGR